MQRGEAGVTGEAAGMTGEAAGVAGGAGQPDALQLDGARAQRTGEPEVVFGEGKTPAQCAAAVTGLLTTDAAPVLVTRADPADAEAVAAVASGARYDPEACVIVARPAPRVAGSVTVVTGGTSDLPVARECAAVLDAFGVTAEVIADVGVAGVHRLLGVRDQLATADAVVAVAGMEGTLPTAVAGLVSAPVLAVPTSVGYGAAFEGLAALLSMLTSCAPGIMVVNIDGGFHAALAARRVLAAGGKTAP
jgi:NCAIR mutase (PurE)-related protein